MTSSVKKGYVTQEEALRVKDEADARTTNAQMPAIKWRIGNDIKSVELYGDIRLRFEDRQVEDPNPKGAHLDLGRFRYALRAGLRGELANDFNYGLRLEIAPTPARPGSLLAAPVPARLTRVHLANPPPG